MFFMFFICKLMFLTSMVLPTIIWPVFLIYSFHYSGLLFLHVAGNIFFQFNSHLQLKNKHFPTYNLDLQA